MESNCLQRSWCQVPAGNSVRSASQLEISDLLFDLGYPACHKFYVVLGLWSLRKSTSLQSELTYARMELPRVLTWFGSCHKFEGRNRWRKQSIVEQTVEFAVLPREL
jgi:hypothetical protein